MRDFFVVSHKYATNIPSTEPIEPNLFTKCWHLNNAIKRLLQLNAISLTNAFSSLATPSSSDGVVNLDNTDLDNEYNTEPEE